MRVRHVENRLNARQRWAVVAVDLLLLIELTCCMYVAQQDMETMTVSFLTLFVPMLLGAYVLARVLIRVLRSPADPTQPAPDDEAGEAGEIA
ncbi:MAG: hypothetical protein AB1916_08885 [Thermodesulfobacteriota bacterium]